MATEAESGLIDPKVDEREERIRRRAYQLWEEDGAPDGRAEEYWHRARQLLENERASPSESGPEARRASNG